jgi:tetratricopeptide (TPR) repeat protein
VNNLFRFGAAAFCLFAAWMWFSISLGRPLIPGRTVARELSRQGVVLAGRDDLAGAREDFSRALAIKPLQWNYYYQRAMVELPLGMQQEALDDFNRTRYLEPHDALNCFYEANLWLTYRPAYAIPALREAMVRHRERAAEFYSGILGGVQYHPDLMPQMLDLATDAKLKLIYLSTVTKEDFNRSLQALLDQDPRLDTLTSEERVNLFRLWYERGDRAKLFQMMDADAVWRKDGWSIIAADRASKGDFQGAFQLALDSVRPPVERMVGHGGDLGQLRREFMLHPTDPTYGLELYEAEKAKGLFDDALSTLAKISQLPEAPKRLPYEESVILARKGEYSKAWEKMNQYIQSIR